MSNQSTPSPRQGPTTTVDESQLPGGQCRYILLLPEIKGQRCACVNFTLNKAMPSASCDCGHLACYHLKTMEPVADNHEIEQLKQRLQDIEKDKNELKQQVVVLQEQLGRDQEVVVRVSELEEVVEKSKEEVTQEVRASYRNLTRAWHSITELERQTKQHDDRLRHVDTRLRDVGVELHHLGQRQLELVDADIAIEDRLDNLEEAVDNAPRSRSRPRRKSTSDSTSPPRRDASFLQVRRRRSFESLAARQHAPTSAPGPVTVPLRGAPPMATALWTVHISLLPTSSQPFPFERDTNAYKRCLSRGLHQMVAINGFDAEAFVSAVERAFGSLLKGRPWMPLQAESCTAEQLAGLPMLRQLEPSMIHGRYDAEFLKRHCAVCDAGGKIDSLYIAMRSDTLSWHFLRRAPVFLEGLEDCWQFDRMLDLNDPFDDDDEAEEVTRPSAGDLIPIPPLKRAASEMSRSSSFGSVNTAAEGEGSRPKVPRLYPLPNIEVRRGVKTS